MSERLYKMSTSSGRVLTSRRDDQSGSVSDGEVQDERLRTSIQAMVKEAFTAELLKAIKPQTLARAGSSGSSEVELTESPLPGI